MPDPKVASVRLAVPGSPGENIYNTYQCLSQILALYAKAQEFEPDEEVNTCWKECSFDLLEEVGMIYQLWGRQQELLSNGFVVTEKIPIRKALIRFSKRLELIERKLTIWHSTERWFEVLEICERRMQTLLTELAQVYAIFGDAVRRAKKVGDGRLARLESISKSIYTSAAQLQASYAVPTALG